MFYVLIFHVSSLGYCIAGEQSKVHCQTPNLTQVSSFKEITRFNDNMIIEIAQQPIYNLTLNIPNYVTNVTFIGHNTYVILSAKNFNEKSILMFKDITVVVVDTKYNLVELYTNYIYFINTKFQFHEKAEPLLFSMKIVTDFYSCNGFLKLFTDNLIILDGYKLPISNTIFYLSHNYSVTSYFDIALPCCNVEMILMYNYIKLNFENCEYNVKFVHNKECPVIIKHFSGFNLDLKIQSPIGMNFKTDILVIASNCSSVILQESPPNIWSKLNQLVVNLQVNSTLYVNTTDVYWNLEVAGKACVHFLKSSCRLNNMNIFDHTSLYVYNPENSTLLLNEINFLTGSTIEFKNRPTIISKLLTFYRCKSNKSLGNVYTDELISQISYMVFDVLEVNKSRIEFAATTLDSSVTCVSSIKANNVISVRYFYDYPPFPMFVEEQITNSIPMIIISAPNISKDQIILMDKNDNRYNGFRYQDSTYKYFLNDTSQGILVTQQPWKSAPSICIHSNNKNYCPVSTLFYENTNINWTEIIYENITKNVFVYIVDNLKDALALPRTDARIHVLSPNNNIKSSALLHVNSIEALQLRSINVGFQGDSVDFTFLEIQDEVKITSFAEFNGFYLDLPFDVLSSSVKIGDVSYLILDMTKYDKIEADFGENVTLTTRYNNATHSASFQNSVNIILYMADDSELLVKNSTRGPRGSVNAVKSDASSGRIRITVDESFREECPAVVEADSFSRVDVDLFGPVIPVSFSSVGFCGVTFKRDLGEVVLSPQPSLENVTMKGYNMSADVVLPLARLQGTGKESRAIAFRREHFDSPFCLRIAAAEVDGCRAHLEGVSVAARLTVGPDASLSLAGADVAMAELSLTAGGGPAITILPGARPAAAPRSLVVAGANGTAAELVRFVGQPVAAWADVVSAGTMEAALVGAAIVIRPRPAKSGIDSSLSIALAVGGVAVVLIAAGCFLAVRQKPHMIVLESDRRELSASILI